jgi:hypothetical protein
MVAFGAVEIIRKAVLAAPTATAAFIGFFPGFDFFESFLNQAVFAPLLCQLLAASFFLTGGSVTVGTRSLLGEYVEFSGTYTAYSFEHHCSPYLP